jgi:hypothetical protein
MTEGGVRIHLLRRARRRRRAYRSRPRRTPLQGVRVGAVGAIEEVESPTPPTASAGRLSGVGPSMLQRRSNRWAPCEDGPPADPLGRDEPPIASSSLSLCSSHTRQAPAAAMMSPRPCGEATAWTTPTCHSGPLSHWAHRHSTTAPATGLRWRRRCALPLSTAGCSCHSDRAWRYLAPCVVLCVRHAASPRLPGSG